MIKKKKVEKVENIEERFKHDGPGPQLSSVQERKLYWRGQRQEKRLVIKHKPPVSFPKFGQSNND
jgi:hypothetical protein